MRLGSTAAGLQLHGRLALMLKTVLIAALVGYVIFLWCEGQK